MKPSLSIAFVLVVISGCSNSTGTPVSKGSGGVSGSGGATVTGGNSGTGGSQATGGSSGGSTGSGGSTVTGGNSGTGGNSTTGGSAGSGGRSGAGGNSTTGGVFGTGGTAGTGSGGNTNGGQTGSGGSSGTGGTSASDGGGSKDVEVRADVLGPDATSLKDTLAGAEVGRETGGNVGDAASYQPCPTNGDPCKVLPLGDSITWGIQYDGAYRVELFTKAVAAQQKITFTGSLSNGPTTVSGQPFPQKNEGHSGWTIAQDTGLIPSPAMDNGSGGIPHIVLLHIGTNDIYAASGQSTMPDRLGTLLDKIIAAAPNALVVVAKITPLSTASWNATIKTYNDAIPGVLQTRVAAGKHVLLADMNTGFTSGMLSTDGIHPNQTGYNFMGDQWYSVIGSLLPK